MNPNRPPQIATPLRLIDAAIIALGLGLGVAAGLIDSGLIEARLGLEPSESTYAAQKRMEPPLPTPPPTTATLVHAVTASTRRVAYPFLTFVTIALGAVALRPRGDGRRGLRLRMRAPGTLAMAVGGTAISVDLANDVALRWLFPGNPPLFTAWIGFAETAGVTIAAAWLLALASRRWRPEPGSLDRLGRLVALLWLANQAWQRVVLQLI